MIKQYHGFSTFAEIYTMATATVKYLGGLRTQCEHLGSGTVIETDAPIDNNGKGEKFSPTDLVATAYASCMLTIIGIYCQNHQLQFNHGEATVTKEMFSNPRRIGKITIEMNLSGNGWSQIEQEKVIRAAKACPVAHSVHENMEFIFDFIFE